MINKLMNNPEAAAAWLQIDARACPLYLADQYILAKLDGREADCLAIEAHLRQLAQMHFERGDVLKGLSQMERYKAMRKPGTRAPKHLQLIADWITAAYHLGDYDQLPDGRIQFFYDTPEGGMLKLTCNNRPGAVALLAAKYRRGLPRRPVKA